ncbi:hypothetical protein PTKU15_86720 [Paraburkholderia terrae]|nr:hypothetical protein PTKU15_86720 [Paraburkholderia terrae]
MSDIGAPDGIHYTVSSTREIIQPTAACGFNDIGVANAGVFTVETRNYEEWRNGTLVRSWIEDSQPQFVRCVDV